MLRRCILITIVVIFGGITVGNAQSSRASLPLVTGASTPLYPIGPHTVNIQGSVRVKMVTDGHRAVTVSVEDDGGHPALARAARENAETWEFLNHDPTSFTVTYRYILVARLKDIESNTLNSKVILRFPTSVEIYAQRWPGNVDVAPVVKK